MNTGEWREQDSEPVYELRPGLRRRAHKMRYTGNQCLLADGHVGRHAWEPSWIEHIAEIERATAGRPASPARLKLKHEGNQIIDSQYEISDTDPRLYPIIGSLTKSLFSTPISRDRCSFYSKITRGKFNLK